MHILHRFFFSSVSLGSKDESCIGIALNSVWEMNFFTRFDELMTDFVCFVWRVIGGECDGRRNLDIHLILFRNCVSGDTELEDDGVEVGTGRLPMLYIELVPLFEQVRFLKMFELAASESVRNGASNK